MTSSSKLFHSRRISFGEDTHSPPADGTLHRRTTTSDRRHHHRNNRQDLGGCNNNSRRIHPHQEHEVVPVEQSLSQPPSGTGSIINSEDFRSIRRWGANGNDRLPGVVLLARERLLERLRGVHVSENRQSGNSASSIRQDIFSYRSFIETNNNLLEDSVPESWQSLMPMSSMTRMLPPGLSQHALNHLSIKVFNNVEDNNETSSASRECSICLEGFEDGDELVNLSCMHRFHSFCLLPWVEVCGACPNCRKDIVVTSN